MSGEDTLKGRKVLLGVSGGIAAYKAAELVRLFVKAGAQVRVVMTKNAQQFITPLTMQTLSQHPVAIDTFDLSQESTISHIDLADQTDVMVFAPATANTIAKLARGIADDVLSTIALATQAPLVVAPAMNVNMWSHPATQDNVRMLSERGAIFVGPEAGELACGWVGAGRLIELDQIVETTRRALAPRDLQGVDVLVTAGPTWEPIDPVRYVGNRSTGKMGFAVATRAAARGARVTLVAGPTSLMTPRGVERVDVETAQQMYDAVMARADRVGVIVKTAAVADHRPAEVAAQKIKKSSLAAAPTVALAPTVDILAELGRRTYANARPILVGFAAETQAVETYAREKLMKKGLDLIVANDVSEVGSGFGTDTNRVTILSRDGRADGLAQMSKLDVADALLDRVLALRTA